MRNRKMEKEMDFEEYRVRGKEMVDYIANYLETIRTRPVFPCVSPGYLKDLVPEAAPEGGEPWMDIYKDIERVIMPGMTHWQSPHMHAYFPALNSFPSLLADMLADAVGCLGFTWASSPVCTELEVIVMDWLAKMINLPEDFHHSNSNTMGGGVIQTTSSEATFVSLLAARTEAIRRYRQNNPDADPAEVNALLVGYCSDQAHSSVEKAGLIGLVKLRLLPCDDDFTLRGHTLRQAVDFDRQNGLIPFFLCATLGTTGACAFDHLDELGPICEEEGIWMHIDAAYAGTAFICPEFRGFMKGIEYASSLAFNPSKWMMVHFDCTAMWVKDSRALHRTFNVEPIYLRHENTGIAIDFMHWQVPLSKRFRALKLWFVIRSFGIEGLQRHIREGVRLAAKFETLVRNDENFEVVAKRHLGLVVFRLKGDNCRTEALLRRLNSSGKVYMVPASLKGRYVIRFTVTSHYTRDEDIERDWSIIRRTAAKILAAEQNEVTGSNDETSEEQETDETHDEKIRRKRMVLKRKDFGLSLILSNVPMSPKFINGSYAAMFDTPGNGIIAEYAKHLQKATEAGNSGALIRISPRRGKLTEDLKRRPFSFDQNLLPPIRGPVTGIKEKMCAGFRQGSLDSKIEEIFGESESDETTGNGEESSEDLRITKFEKLKNGEALRENGAMAAAPRAGEHEKKNSVRKRIACKHCGHEIE